MKIKIFRITAILLFLAGGMTACSVNGEVQRSCVDEKGCVDEWRFEIGNASKCDNFVEMKVTMSINPFGYETIDLARENWECNGFTFYLPKTINPNYLMPIDFNLPTTVDISNKNAKIGTVFIAAYDKDGSFVNNLAPCKEIKDGYYVQANYVYVDSDVTISGYYKSESVYNEAMITYSLEYKKGWNVWYYLSYRTRTGDKVTVANEWTTTPVSSLKWYGEERHDWEFRII